MARVRLSPHYPGCYCHSLMLAYAFTGVFLNVCIWWEQVGGWNGGGAGRRFIMALFISCTFVKVPWGKENLEYENMEFEIQSTQTPGSQSL